MNSSCENNNMQSSCNCGCGCCNAWQTLNQGGQMMNTMPGCGCQQQPIVMPTQVVARQAFTCVEQPVIMPIECRTINRMVAVPRFYPTYTQTWVNCRG